MKKATNKNTLKKRIQAGIRRIRVLAKKSQRRNKSLSQRTSSRKKTSLKKKSVSKPRKKRSSLKTVSLATSTLKHTEEERIEVSKFSAVETSLKEPERFNLPLRYNDNRIVLIPRDPWWIHTYWDISQEKINETTAKIPLHERENLKWALRVHDVTGISNFTGYNSHSFYDIDINFDAYNWYINVNAPEREWCVEIGLKTKNGRFFVVLRSNIIKTPYFGISDIVDEEWALPDEDYFRVLGVYDLGRSSLERRKKLEELLKQQISSGFFSGALSSLSSLREKKKERKFFLEVWTELILYGRTTPDAAVSVCGKKIKLRDDGTFSIRYALPEGNFRFDVSATSQDKEETITIIPAVKRYTIK